MTNMKLRIATFCAWSGAVWMAAASSITAAASGPPLVERALKAMGGAEEIVFVVRGLYEDGHYYANFGHWSSDSKKMMYAAGGSRLCKLNLRTRQVTELLADRAGGIRDPRIAYDGRTILFAYRQGGTEYSHLHEMRPDGSGLRQLTSGNWDDVEPDWPARNQF